MAEEQEWANLLAEIFDKLTQKHASIKDNPNRYGFPYWKTDNYGKIRCG
jgi:hypothetical protein